MQLLSLRLKLHHKPIHSVFSRHNLLLNLLNQYSLLHSQCNPLRAHLIFSQV